MIKKIATFSLAGFAVIALSGCAGQNQNQTVNNNEGENQQEQMQNQEQSQEGNGSIIDNFKDAIGLGQKMKCTYTMTEDGETFQSEAYIEGNKFKSVSTVNGQEYYAISDDDATYTWISGSGKGTKLSKNCDLGTSSTVSGQQDATDEEMTEEDMFENAADVKCEPVGSIDFSVPSDVQFVDQCQLLQNQSQQLQQLQQQTQQQIQQNLPEGVSIPGLE